MNPYLPQQPLSEAESAERVRQIMAQHHADEARRQGTQVDSTVGDAAGNALDLADVTGSLIEVVTSTTSTVAGATETVVSTGAGLLSPVAEGASAAVGAVAEGIGGLFSGLG
ncbi:hypothetical protein DB346_03070 [Verrucomicrobia bacterium LW23]|nr:hypothetical protein DB346_03585 [Verrucomicrobia bacterium LW23]PTY04431.1 hypothetical protein DB346_03070 [Verrucomicrobia bacterium LW23]